jgi:REP element-mobilizing transposase RayT/predicted transcriptional regulator
MVQSIAQENIFPDDNSKGYYLASICDAKDKYHINVLGYCVMSNHAHLLLSADGVQEITNFMGFLNTRYARYYNDINGRVGYVFRDRFKSEIITNEKYLLNCLAYIHNNPVKAKVIDKASEYKYSSYANYLSSRGIVDFKIAAQIYDVSPSNIKAIMAEKSHSDWIEHDDKTYEKYEEVLEELVKRYNINSNNIDEELAGKIAVELKERTKLSYRKIANILGIPRETLRRSIAENGQ